MDLFRRRFLGLAAGGAAAFAFASHGNAQSYASREVRIIGGFPVGGLLDIAARVIAPWLSDRFG